MTHSDATAKPIDRARGGMAAASTVKMPGVRMARAPVMTALTTRATAMFGAKAKPISPADTPQAT